MDTNWSSLVFGSNTFQYCTDEVVGKGMFGVVNPARLMRNGKVVMDNLCVKVFIQVYVRELEQMR